MSGIPKETAKALVDYGYTQNGTLFTLYAADGFPTDQQWEWAGDHWKRFEMRKPAYPGGIPAEMFEGVIRQQYPHHYRGEFADSARYEFPERWAWEWPDDEVRPIYASAVERGEGARNGQ